MIFSSFYLGGGYCSYIKDHDGYGYLKRRIKKLFPIYFAFCLLWLPYQYIVYSMGYKSVIGNVFALEGFVGTGNEYNWYITCLVVFYIIVPYLSELVFRNDRKRNLLVIAISFLISVSFWGSHNIMIASRVPLLILGLIFGKNKNTVISKKMWLCSILLFILGIISLELVFLFSHESYLEMGIFWYPQILIVPTGFMIFFSVFNYFHKTICMRVLRRVLSIIGENTFEIYLSHIFLNRMAIKMGVDDNINIIIICLGGILPMVFALKVISRYISHRCG